MQTYQQDFLKQIHLPLPDSHKGQNGKLLLIGGSSLFHAASLWALTIASRIVDMVFYASVPENNGIVHEAKRDFRNGIVIGRSQLEEYAAEADCILIGPGMVRAEKPKEEISRMNISSLEDINALQGEGEQSYWLTKYLLGKYPQKKWVIDAGALQMMEPDWLIPLQGNAVVTPHQREFEKLFGDALKEALHALPVPRESFAGIKEESEKETVISAMAKRYNCIILVKGKEDIICSAENNMKVTGGNAGMTKGGTGDILAGLVASLACTNTAWQSACAGSYLNKKAGDALYERVGYYFNSTDLADEIPVVMKKLLLG